MSSVFLKSFGHYIEQPRVIQSAWKASKYAALAGGAAVIGWDVAKAEPHEKKKTFIRDAFVLGATGIGTALAARFLMKKPGVIKSAFKELSGKYSDDIAKLIKKEGKTPEELEKLFKTIPHDDLEKLYGGKLVHEWEGHVLAPYLKAKAAHPELASLLGKHKTRQEFAELMEKMGEEEFNKYFIDEHSHGFGEMLSFFTVGGASIISGFLGGLAAKKINNEPDGKTVAMIKEGIFQFIANIAMCAVGASVGLGVSKAVFKPSQKLARFGTVGLGLMAGITGGGAIANYVGNRWVNPFFDKLEGKAPNSTEKRKVEFWDAILHLDDLPTALALAGVEVMKPFIPLFFAFSGYRTGIGYRNHHKHHPVRDAINNHLPGTNTRKAHLDANGKQHGPHTGNHSGFDASMYTQSVHTLIRKDSPFALLHEQISTKTV